MCWPLVRAACCSAATLPVVVAVQSCGVEVSVRGGTGREREVSRVRVEGALFARGSLAAARLFARAFAAARARPVRTHLAPLPLLPLSPCSGSVLSLVMHLPLAFADAARSAPEYPLRRSLLPSARFLHAGRSPSPSLSPHGPPLPMVTLPCYAGCPRPPRPIPRPSGCAPAAHPPDGSFSCSPTEHFFLWHVHVLLRPPPGNARPIRQGRRQRTAGEAPGRPLPSPPPFPSLPLPHILLTLTRRHLQRTACSTPLPPTLFPSSLLTLSLNALPPPLLPLPPMCHLWNAGYSLLHFPLSRIAGKRTVVHVVHAPWHTHRAWPRCQCEVSSVHWIAC